MACFGEWSLASSICNAHFTSISSSCHIVFFSASTRCSLLVDLPAYLHKLHYVVAAHTTAYRGPSTFLPSNNNSRSRACSCSRFSTTRLGTQLKSPYHVAQTTSHGSSVGALTALDSTTTHANHSHLQSSGNAACLAGSETGGRTGPRMGHRGTCYPLEATHTSTRAETSE